MALIDIEVTGKRKKTSIIITATALNNEKIFDQGTSDKLTIELDLSEENVLNLESVLLSKIRENIVYRDKDINYLYHYNTDTGSVIPDNPVVITEVKT